MTDLLNHRYRILQTLGAGGFGQTFLVEDTQLPSKRRCVMKQLKPISDRPELYQLIQARFEREATILEALGEGHQQIPKLYAYFESNRLFYLVQEWIDGATLAQALVPGKTGEQEVKALLMSLLPVLSYIHGKGIIHRDIKPENIILRRSNQQPVLIDFGAVKETVRTALNTQGQPTRSIVIGTPGYMPPEQAVGKPVYSSDLYSLGLTAIYLLTGRSPYDLETNPQTGEFIWQSFAPSICPEFVAVLSRAIQSHVRDRFATAEEMQLALQTVQAISPDISTSLPQTQMPFNPLPPTVYPASAEPSTIITSSQPSQPLVSHVPESSVNPKAARNTVLFGSFIASGLIGASVIIATSISRSPQNVTLPTRSTSETSPTVEQPITNESIANSTPEQPIVNSPTDNSPIAPDTGTQTPIASSSSPSPTIQFNEFAWLSTRSVTEADLVGKTAFELDILRNAIFAQHGRRFNDEALQAYFNSRPWYQPLYIPSQFPDSLLSELEKDNVQFILQYQDRTGLK
jgi:serine/threonine-protein kinase